MTTIPDSTTPDVPTTAATDPARPSRSPLWAIFFAVGTFVLGLIGGWLLSDNGDGSATWGGEIDGVVLNEIDGLLDDYWAAFDAGDGDGVVALMTSDGWYSTDTTTERGITGDQLATYVDHLGGAEFTRVGPAVVVENWTGYEAAVVHRVEAPFADPESVLVHLTIADQDGQLRISSFRVISTF